MCIRDRYRNQLSDANAITLTWDGSKYIGTATYTNGVLPQYYFSTNISGVTVNHQSKLLLLTTVLTGIPESFDLIRS